ncbi:hypothetical protein FRB94_005704 [Tulasnella sp. JGI-2019a]|nr:hypothetical protein FRB93_003720 [Tulasnella sp. JGI-2019a]KAG9000021.1 hypothetical protein FRB94_005704 [Tulasnella sp. JGI-2019a]KAG9030526.1 hypothetical protein FRB95_003855 [Tulasnella sp. JGI-2019a]
MGVTEYKSLKNFAQWEIGLELFMLCDWERAIPIWCEFGQHANWSKATCAYALAIALYETGGEENLKEAQRLFSVVPTVIQKIGGKSEKFTSRKSRKFEVHGNRLLYPGIEFSYLLSGVPHTSRSTLFKTHSISQIYLIHVLNGTFVTQRILGCLALINLLYGICLRYVASRPGGDRDRRGSIACKWEERCRRVKRRHTGKLLEDK